MYRSLPLRAVPLALPLLAFAVGGACTTSGNVPVGSSQDGGASDSPFADASEPDTWTCSGDPSACLSGRVTLSGEGDASIANGFTVAPRHLIANLFKTYPGAGVQQVAGELVAKDGTWAFAGLDPWEHYYVQIIGEFELADGGGASVPAVVGPVSVPSSSALTVRLLPAQIQLLEAESGGGPMQLSWVAAHVYDPTSGAEITGDAAVSITVGSTATPVPWGTAPGGTPAYYLAFPASTAAQGSYVVSTTIGSTTSTWNLVASPPTFTPSLASPADGASVPADQALDVTWPAQPADFEQVEVFASSDGGYSATYSSPHPDQADVTKETVPASAVAQPGSYLVEVSFVSAGCPQSADGCVLAAVAADATITAK